MDLTQLWYQLVDMSKSEKVFATVAGFSISESQLLWVAVVIILIIVFAFVRAFAGWIVAAGSKKSEVIIEKKPEVTIPPQSNTPATATTDSKSDSSNSPQELMTDTSDRRRSLSDYVTPDTIHTDVMKQTLNNDYPYQSLNPNPQLVGQNATVPTEPIMTTQQVKIDVAPTVGAQGSAISGQTTAVMQPIVPPETIPEKTLTALEFSAMLDTKRSVADQPVAQLPTLPTAAEVSSVTVTLPVTTAPIPMAPITLPTPQPISQQQPQQSLTVPSPTVVLPPLISVETATVQPVMQPQQPIVSTPKIQPMEIPLQPNISPVPSIAAPITAVAAVPTELPLQPAVPQQTSAPSTAYSPTSPWLP